MKTIRYNYLVKLGTKSCKEKNHQMTYMTAPMLRPLVGERPKTAVRRLLR